MSPRRLLRRARGARQAVWPASWPPTAPRARPSWAKHRTTTALARPGALIGAQADPPPGAVARGAQCLRARDAVLGRSKRSPSGPRIAATVDLRRPDPVGRAGGVRGQAPRQGPGRRVLRAPGAADVDDPRRRAARRARDPRRRARVRRQAARRRARHGGRRRGRRLLTDGGAERPAVRRAARAHSSPTGGVERAYLSRKLAVWTPPSASVTKSS